MKKFKLSPHLGPQLPGFVPEPHIAWMTVGEATTAT
jgi:hypothetical protein